MNAWREVTCQAISVKQKVSAALQWPRQSLEADDKTPARRLVSDKPIVDAATTVWCCRCCCLWWGGHRHHHHHCRQLTAKRCVKAQKSDSYKNWSGTCTSLDKNSASLPKCRLDITQLLWIVLVMIPSFTGQLQSTVLSVYTDSYKLLFLLWLRTTV